MTPHFQTTDFDCFRTAIACLLDTPPEQVPCAFSPSGTAEEQTAAARAWLAGRGYSLAVIHMVAPDEQSVLTYMGEYNPDIYWLLSGASPYQCDYNHVVICKGGKIVHDPSPRKGGIAGPCHGSATYRVEFLVPLSKGGCLEQH